MITLSPIQVVRCNELLQKQLNPFYVDEHARKENFIAKLKDVDKTNTLRSIGITLEAEDPLWQCFYSFIIRHDLTMEEGLKHLLADYLQAERAKLARGQKTVKLCPRCGGQKWTRYKKSKELPDTVIVRCRNKKCKAFYTVTPVELKGMKYLRIPRWDRQFRKEGLQEWKRNQVLTSLFQPQGKESSDALRKSSPPCGKEYLPE